MEYQIIEEDLFISIKDIDDVKSVEYYHKYSNIYDLLFKIYDFMKHVRNNEQYDNTWVYNSLYRLFYYIEDTELWMQEAGNSDLYFIIDDTKTKVKIGRSKNVDNRFKQLKSTTPFDIELLKVIDNGGMFEKKIHKSFEHCNLKFNKPFDGYTEWFYIDNKLNSFISSIDNKKLIKKYGS